MRFKLIKILFIFILIFQIIQRIDCKEKDREEEVRID